MSVFGTHNRWASLFPDTLIPRVLGLIVDSWKDFRTTQAEEVPITQEFFIALDHNHELLRLPFLIDFEVILPSGTGSAQQGRIDLRIIQGYCRKVYFSIECKRLHVNFPSGFKTLADKYVTEGMYRYFNGQYASGLDKGGMLGYVMDGKVDQAIIDVQAAIESRRADLSMRNTETLKACSIFTSPQAKETCHNYGPHKKFTVFHVFLPFN